MQIFLAFSFLDGALLLNKSYPKKKDTPDLLKIPRNQDHLTTKTLFLGKLMPKQHYYSLILTQ